MVIVATLVCGRLSGHSHGRFPDAARDASGARRRAGRCPLGKSPSENAGSAGDGYGLYRHQIECIDEIAKLAGSGELSGGVTEARDARRRLDLLPA